MPINEMYVLQPGDLIKRDSHETDKYRLGRFDIVDVDGNLVPLESCAVMMWIGDRRWCNWSGGMHCSVLYKESVVYLKQSYIETSYSLI